MSINQVVFESVSKSFGTTQVVKNFNLSVKKGEFLSLLGPSGCGKTTSLRMLAGLEQNSSGKIYIGENLVSDTQNNFFIAPEKRNLGMVFQSYAIWPHMNVFDNIAFPLKMAKKAKPEIYEKVHGVLELVEMSGLDKRLPDQLSGGQQQRVALARGLVSEPQVLLLDEPLSNLDAKLREKMRHDICNIQQKLNMTVVYVTHDQVEALEMSDRMLIMNEGQIIQLGFPKELKENPCNDFVRSFLN